MTEIPEPKSDCEAHYVSDPYFQTLARELEGGDCAIFVGAGASVAAGLPTWGDLERTMRSAGRVAGVYSAARVADCCREVLGHRRFNELLGREVRGAGPPTRLHEQMARLPVRIFITTNFDTLLERALAERFGPDRVEVLSLADPSRWLYIPDAPVYPYVLKIHGCAVRTPERLVISEEDFIDYATSYPFIIQALRELLARKAVLFVGYSLSDWNLLSILYHVNAAMAYDNPNRYFVGFDLETPFRRFLEKRYQLRVFDLAEKAAAASRESTLLGFFDNLLDEIEVPEWLYRLIAEIGGPQEVWNLRRTTELASLFPGWDVTARVRLAIRIEAERAIRLPLERAVEPSLTVEGLLALVRDSDSGPD